MTKREHFLRYIAIIKKLRNNQRATFEEMMDFLERDAEIYSYHTQMSRRTFQRDLQEILSIFNIEIRYDFSERVYRIVEEEDQRDMNNRMLEALDILNLCNMSDKASPFVVFEKRRPRGTENFNGLLHAIQNRKVIRFTYEKFWDGIRQQREADPYALRESGNRWYLLARDHKDDRLKTFGLDRITELHLQPRGYSPAAGPDPHENFRYCFGVLSEDGHEPEEVILSVEPRQGRYIKSFPLHETQQILEDNNKELRIKLHIYLSYDFVMELLSLGETLKVVAPKRLQKMLCNHYRLSLAQYKS